MSIISPHLLLLKAFQGNLQAMLLSSQIVQLGLGLQSTFSGVNHGMQVVPTQTTLDSASMCSLQSPLGSLEFAQPAHACLPAPYSCLRHYVGATQHNTQPGSGNRGSAADKSPMGPYFT